jgi:predicted RNA binding protein YcfA (HicA-like mRNA interferase family)
MDSATVIRRIVADGWELVRIKGSHHHYKHPAKPGIVTVVHPLKEVPKGTLGSIQRQARIKLRD